MPQYFVPVNAPADENSGVRHVGAPEGAERVGGHAGHEGQPGVVPATFTVFQPYQSPKPKRRAAKKADE